jgi:hypothetical protein
MKNKAINYIVVDKSGLVRTECFERKDDVSVNLLGRRLKDILIITNESKVVDIGSLGTGDVFEIGRIIEKELKMKNKAHSK